MDEAKSSAERITRTTVDGAKPAAKEFFLWDSEVKGFGLKVFPTGAKSFVFQYRTPEGRTRRFTIGRYSDTLTPDQARKRAKELFADVVKGSDPQTEKQEQRKAGTVEQLLDAYLESSAFATKAESTQAIDRGRINRHLKPIIGRIYVDKLTPDDVKRARQAIAAGKTAVSGKSEKKRGRVRVTGGEGTADKAVLALRAAIAWAMDEGLAQSNPAARVKVSQTGQRETIIEDAAVYKRLFETLAKMETERRLRSPVADAIRLIALTGARRGEVSGLRWKWVDLKARQIMLPPKAHKTGHRTGRPRIIALPAAACEILARQDQGEPDDYVFPPAKGEGAINLSSPWQKIRKEAKLPPDLGLHGLRHSIGSHMAMGGASINEIMEVLGHRQHSTAQRYIHFAERARSALADKAASVALAGMKADESKAEVVDIGEGKKSNTAA